MINYFCLFHHFIIIQSRFSTSDPPFIVIYHLLVFGILFDSLFIRIRHFWHLRVPLLPCKKQLLWVRKAIKAINSSLLGNDCFDHSILFRPFPLRNSDFRLDSPLGRGGRLKVRMRTKSDLECTCLHTGGKGSKFLKISAYVLCRWPPVMVLC